MKELLYFTASKSVSANIINCGCATVHVCNNTHDMRHYHIDYRLINQST